jgi:flagellar hook-associated protein 1 FlgK
MGITPVFDLAARALRAQNLVLQTAGQNIANASRPSYSRQRVVLAADPPQSLSGIVVGSGVRVQEVQQVVSTLTEKQLLQARSRSAEEIGARDELSQLEAVLGELGGGGLQEALDSFFAAADDLALHPQGIPERTIFLATAETLVARFQDRATQLAELQRQIDERVAAAVPEVNGHLDDIATLNGEIFRAEVGGQNANDLRDQRREALGQLSDLIGITQFETDGQVTVMGPDGLPLVEGSQATHLVADTTTAPTLTGLDGRALTRLGFVGFSSTIEGGEIGGLLAVRDTDIPSVAASLDQLAGALRTAVNAVHTNGEDLDGNAGGSLFGGTTASTLTVLITDPREVAASLGTGTPEDNQNARALAALQYTVLDGTDATLGNADLDGSNFVGFLSSMIGTVGALSQAAQDRAEAAEAVTTEIQNRRAALSGVSTNEELLTLLDAQRSFQAAAILINTATGTLDALLAMVQ